jgi:hypothetical protein
MCNLQDVACAAAAAGLLVLQGDVPCREVHCVLAEPGAVLPRNVSYASSRRAAAAAASAGGTVCH